MRNLIEKIKQFFQLLISKNAVIVELSLIYAIATFLVFEFTSLDKLKVIIAFSIIYLVLLIVLILLFKRKKSLVETEGVSISNAILNTLQKLSTPIFIVNKKKGTIIWNNKSANSLINNNTNSLHGKRFADLIEILSTDSVSGKLEIKVNNKYFEVVPFNTVTSSTQIIVFELIDITELLEVQTKRDAESLILGYISVDNLNDYINSEQQNIKDASIKIENLLIEWAHENDSILKEYDKNRYLFLCSHEKFNEFVENKFDILDKVREITIGDTIIPVTISVGISNISDPSFLKKEEIARSALDMALQRGGDQIVVKNDSEIDFFGGRTKTLAKRTKVHARSIAEKILVYMAKASNILIMGHKFADFDSIAACVGIARIASFCGVKANIVANKNDINTIQSLKLLGNDSLYKSMIVDNFNAMDLVTNDTLLIVCDCNNFNNVESPELTFSCSNNIIIIDHHRKTTEYVSEPLISYIEPSSSSASELVTEMIDFLLPSNQLPVNEANMLLAGILLDTKQFNKNSGTRTFSAVQFLIEHGADSGEAQKLFKINIEDYVNEGKFRNNAVTYRNCTVIAVCKDEGYPEDRIVAAKAADKLLSVNGVRASFSLIKIDNSIHISARSDGSINVQLILEELKGGGHFDSAGAQLEGETLESALKLLKAAIDKYINNETKKD